MPAFVDLTGQTFGKLTALRRGPDKIYKSGRAFVQWTCRCQCGQIVNITSNSLRGPNQARSCGCLRYANDLTGRRFDRWTVLGRANEIGTWAIWRCRCDCGKEGMVRTDGLQYGHSRSCGCSYKLPLNHASQRRLYHEYERRAHQRETPFELALDEFISLTSKECVYCGGSPSRVVGGRTNGNYVYNGIDRVDNSRGYVSGNCVSCCKNCNWMKGNMIREDFLAHVSRIFQTSISADD